MDLYLDNGCLEEKLKPTENYEKEITQKPKKRKTELEIEQELAEKIFD